MFYYQFSQKCLGIYLDKRLAFDVHIENLCKKICSGIGVLRRIKRFVSKDCLLKLYESLIQPYFDYLLEINALQSKIELHLLYSLRGTT